jgi:hypothetical protein
MSETPTNDQEEPPKNPNKVEATKEGNVNFEKNLINNKLPLLLTMLNEKNPNSPPKLALSIDDIKSMIDSNKNNLTRIFIELENNPQYQSATLEVRLSTDLKVIEMVMANTNTDSQNISDA